MTSPDFTYPVGTAQVAFKPKRKSRLLWYVLRYPSEARSLSQSVYCDFSTDASCPYRVHSRRRLFTETRDCAVITNIKTRNARCRIPLSRAHQYGITHIAYLGRWVAFLTALSIKLFNKFKSSVRCPPPPRHRKCLTSHKNPDNGMPRSWSKRPSLWNMVDPCKGRVSVPPV